MVLLMLWVEEKVVHGESRQDCGLMMSAVGQEETDRSALYRGESSVLVKVGGKSQQQRSTRMYDARWSCMAFLRRPPRTENRERSPSAKVGWMGKQSSQAKRRGG
jgi:hypothetical protein